MMDESNAGAVPEADISTLEEALCAQQQLLQLLYTDLDVEREASATAASEALSMILRLQGEKASMMMEASQYKRMAEEKICHAEEALAIFEDLIYQREMEIASLEFQVQAYRYRLISMGCNDLGVYENKIPENLLMQRNDILIEEKVFGNNMKSLNSSPSIPIKDSNYMKSTIERKRSVIPAPDSVPTNVDEIGNQEVNDSEKKSGSFAVGDINGYWEQIKKLDERVKEISDSKDSCRNKSAIWSGGTWSPSLFSQASLGTSADPTRGVHAPKSDQVKHHEDSHGKEGVVSSDCSTSVQDIFEVPKTTDIRKACEHRKKECSKLILEGRNRLVKPDFASEDTVESLYKDETDRVQSMLLSKRSEKKMVKPRDGKSVDHNSIPLARAKTVIGDSQAEYQQLIRRIEQLERARNNVRHEIVDEGEDELIILKEIREQLKSIQSEMTSWRSKKSLLPNEPSLDLLRDAMLYFWM